MQLSNQDEYPIVFRGQGLADLRVLARELNIPETDIGQVVVKALKLLQTAQQKGELSYKEGGREYIIDIKRL